MTILVSYLLVHHCYQSSNSQTNWCPSVLSSLGGVPRPQASPRITGTPRSGAGRWPKTLHSLGSNHQQEQDNERVSSSCFSLCV